MGTIDLITPPIGGIPLTTDDYNAQNALLQQLLFQYNMKQLHLTDWENLVKPKIKLGTSIQHGGAQFSVNDSDVDIAGTPADGLVYVQLIRVGDQLQPSFITSIAGYSWDYVYCGFYNSSGFQVLPYRIEKNGTDWEKFLWIEHRIKNYAQSSGVEIANQDGTGSFEFYLKKSISAYIWWEYIGPGFTDNGFEIYQNGDWRRIATTAITGTDSYEYLLQLNPGRYRLYNAGVNYNINLMCTGVAVSVRITANQIVREI